MDKVATALLHTTGGADLVAAGPGLIVAVTGTRGDSQPTSMLKRMFGRLVLV
ncbi:hypothetical protein D3C87_2164220 [compost metagenome]